MYLNEIGCYDRLIDLARKLDKADREALSRAAVHLTKMEQYPFAAEVYSKMGDIRALINLHVEAKHWEDVRMILISFNVFISQWKQWPLNLYVLKGIKLVCMTVDVKTMDELNCDLYNR